MIGFDEFFARAHRNPETGEEPQPYDWQLRFAAACAEGRPPAVVAVPTGAGKTGVLDALVWALAAQAELPASERTVGARIVWAIDRRILVDQVFEHAEKLADALRDALKDSEDRLHGMAERLARLSPQDGMPLAVTRWRGGLEEDDEPLLAPTQPQVITSTVAQVGSRLLYRGYGVGLSSLSLQAGLAGCDTNICLDEAHLAQPFAETVAAVRRRRAGASGDVSLPPLNAITLSATPGETDDEVIFLSDRDREQLGARYAGEKRVTLDDSAPKDAARAKRIAELAHAHLEGGAKRVACIVNTVRQALAVHGFLAKGAKKGEYDVALLIGPQRPHDREETLNGPFRHLLDGTEPERPVVCVATQTFEVGLDADVEALLTESAAADALVQRFGRLNRRGGSVGRATVVRAPESWLYGEDEEAAWAWLEERVASHGGDISVGALEQERGRPVPQRVAFAPELRPDVVDLLVQTNPRLGQFQDVDVDPYLSGAESEPESDVAFCWRCDLRLAPVGAHPAAAAEYRENLLQLAPPAESEKLSLGLHAAKAFLATHYPGQTTKREAAMRSALDEADVEGPSPHGNLPPIGTADGVPFVVLRQRECLEGALTDSAGEGRVGPDELRPGDTVVLPETSKVSALDLMRLAPEAARDVALDLREPSVNESLRWIRISPEALGRAGGSELKAERWREIARLCRTAEAKGDAAAVGKLVNELAAGLLGHPVISRFAEQAREDPSTLKLLRVVDPAREDLGELEELLIEGVADDGGSPHDEVGDLPDGGDDDSGESGPPAPPVGPTWILVRVKPRERQAPGGPPPTLDSHAQAVRRRVEQFVDPLGLPPSIASALVYAARTHDHGKADRRIQAFFNGGLLALGRPLLAKSVFGTGDPVRSRQAARVAGMPRSLHHEVASTAIAMSPTALEVAPALRDSEAEVYLDLAAHLIYTHHGRNRPFLTPPRGGDPPSGVICEADGAAGSATGDGVEDWLSGEPLARFTRVVDYFGPWATSFLEAILMLADRTVSAEGR